MPSPIALDEKHQEDEAAVEQEMAKVRRTWKSLGFKPFGKDILVMDPAMVYHDEAVMKFGPASYTGTGVTVNSSYPSDPETCARYADGCTGGTRPTCANSSGSDFWQQWTVFISYASLITTTAAIMTAGVPGVDVVTGGIATITDGAALLTNTANTALALRNRQYGAAAWDGGSAFLGALGFGAAGRAFGAAAAKDVEQAAGDVAESGMGQFLRAVTSTREPRSIGRPRTLR